MKRAALAALLTLALCIADAAAAQTLATPPAPAMPSATAPSITPAPLPADAVTLIPPGTPPVPLLWKVADADNAVYLLGSFHMLKPDDYPLSNDVNAAFADAASVVFEMPPAEMASPQLGVQMAQAALRTDGTTLDSQLTAATRAKLAAWLSAHGAQMQASGLTAQALQGFEPWFVGLLVTITEMGGKGFDPALGVDRHFMDAAASAGKRTDGFETGTQQIAFLDGMSPTEQLQMLDEALSQPDAAALPDVAVSAAASSVNENAPQRARTDTPTIASASAAAPAPPPDIASLHAAWRAGDADGLWNGMGQQLRLTYPDLYRRINVERNDAWLPKVESMLAAPGTDDTLVVVGALHLLGSDGLVDKLRAQGYTVERICSACAVNVPPTVLTPAASPGSATQPSPSSATEMQPAPTQPPLPLKRSAPAS